MRHRRLRKYGVIFKATLMESLQYVGDIVLGFISYIMLIYIFVQLWEYMYDDPTQLISGYTKAEMMWYVILTEMLWFGTGNRTLTGQMSQDIKSGGIAYGLNKPYHYVAYVITKNFGEIVIKFMLYTLLGIAIGCIFAGPLPHFNILLLPVAALAYLLGILINAITRMLISTLSFWVDDSVPFHWIYDKLLLVVGTLFPIEMFPLWAQPVIRMTPIYAVAYGPVKLVINFSIELFTEVLTAQLIYLAVTGTLLVLLYQKGVKKLSVYGG